MSHIFRIGLVTACFYALAVQAMAVEIRGESLPAELKRTVMNELTDEETPETRFEARRRARRAADQVLAYLNSRGYFLAEAIPVVESDAPFGPVVDVIPGKQFVIGKIEVRLISDNSSESLLTATQAALGLKQGDIAIPAEILAAELRAVTALKGMGFADAAAGRRDVLGDAERSHVDLTFVLMSGPPIVFGQVVYVTDTGVRERYLDRLVPFDTGDGYTPERLNRLNRRLSETRLYDVSAARISDAASAYGENGEEVRDVLVTAELRKRYSIALGAGFSTTEGPGVSGELLRRNATGRGDLLRLNTVLAQQEQFLGASWDIPHALGFGRNVSANIIGGREDTDAFDRNSLVVGAGVNVARDNNWVLGFSGAGEYSRETDAVEQRDLFILSTIGSARLDRTNSLLDPSKGWRAGLQLEPGLIFGDQEDAFFSIRADTSVYQPLDNRSRFVVAARARTSAIFGNTTADLPVSRRFFAGGNGSARGFGFQEIGPIDADGTPLGGRSLLELSTELRWRYSQTLGFAFFADSASVTDRTAPSFEDLRVGLGAGIRYYTPIGPIRFDIGTPINRQPGEDAVQFHISIGQAF